MRLPKTQGIWQVTHTHTHTHSHSHTHTHRHTHTHHASPPKVTCATSTQKKERGSRKQNLHSHKGFRSEKWRPTLPILPCVLHVDLVSVVESHNGVLLAGCRGSEHLGRESQAQLLVLWRHLDGLVHHLLQLGVGQLLRQGHCFLETKNEDIQECLLFLNYFLTLSAMRFVQPWLPDRSCVRV